MEFALGGAAAMCAGCFTNPLEVLKTRMQLQGELQAKGQHVVHYRNVLHAGYVVAKNDGVLALQKGLAPALWVQLILNGMRLGTFQFCDNRGYIRDKEGNIVFAQSALCTGFGGVLGQFFSSPLFLVKTQLQSQATKTIAVGHQHEHNYFEDKRLLTSFLGAMVGGVAVSITMTPFDLILTRLYNQPTDDKGKGKLYKGYLDCVIKIYRREGLPAFYKGFGPMYLRLGPHSILCLVFWDQFKALENKYFHK
nr:unnamed protein product [Callosobruchus analis]